MGRSLEIAIAIAVSCAACTPLRATPHDDRRARNDVDVGPASPDAGVPPAPKTPSDARDAGAKPRRLVKASSRALALDEAHVYYADADADELYAIAKEGGEPTRVAHRAPVAGALAIDDGAVSWIATPGDVVLHVPVTGGAVTTLREHGLYADVAALGGQVFVLDALGGGGDLLRTTAPQAKVATFEGSPRAIAIDATYAYVATATKLLRIAVGVGPHAARDVETLYAGSDLDSPQVDDTSVYVASTDGADRVVVRIAKADGSSRVVVKGLRVAPVAVAGGEILWFDAARPELRATPIAGGAARVLAADESLAHPNAIAADANTVYVAVGERDDGAVLAIPR